MIFLMYYFKSNNWEKSAKKKLYGIKTLNNNLKFDKNLYFKKKNNSILNNLSENRIKFKIIAY